MKQETKRLLQEMDKDIETCKPPFGFGFIKPLLEKAVQLLTLFDERISQMEKESVDEQ